MLCQIVKKKTTFVIEVPVPSHESEWSCFNVGGIYFVSLCDFDIIFCNCSDSVTVFVFHFI